MLNIITRTQPSRSKSAGFTLIELLVVIVIIGILSGLGLGSFMSSQQKARDARRKGDLDNISKALELYYNDKGVYPVGDGVIEGCASAAPCQWGDEWQDDNGTFYMVQLPSDPSGGYNYHYVSAGADFQIYARLENLKDGSIPTDGGGNPLGYTGTVCTVEGSECNYGVSSTNSTL